MSFRPLQSVRSQQDPGLTSREVNCDSLTVQSIRAPLLSPVPFADTRYELHPVTEPQLMMHLWPISPSSDDELSLSFWQVNLFVNNLLISLPCLVCVGQRRPE